MLKHVENSFTIIVLQIKILGKLPTIQERARTGCLFEYPSTSNIAEPEIVQSEALQC